MVRKSLTPRNMKRQATATRKTAETNLTLFNESKATGEWQIVVAYSYKGNKKRFPTGCRVKEAQWNAAKQEIKAGALDIVKAVNLNGKKELSPTVTANTHIRMVKANLDTIIRQQFQLHGAKPSIATLEAEYEKLKAPEASEDASVRTNVLEALESFIQTKDVKPNSLKAYSALLQNLTLYFEAKGQDWDLETLSVADIDAFQKWLTTAKKFHNATVERRVIAMKKFLESHKDSLTFNYRELKPTHPVKAAKNLVVVTLTTDELKALEALDLTGHPRMHRVQQLFLLQCWTGLRFSDVVRLNAAHIAGNTVRIDIDKTDDYSAVPLFPTAERILGEIGIEPISVSNQEYNRVLKDVMQTLAQTLPSLLTPITQLHAVGKQKTQTTKPKWAWTTTHTARRTFVTICIQKSVPQHFVMRWSNHSDPRSFRKYQNAIQGESEAAQQLIAAFNS